MNALELPTEILAKIFDHYVHDCSKVRQGGAGQATSYRDDFRHIAAYVDSQTHPVDLTHVCRRWRTTAISIPRLWATIHVYESYDQSERDVKMFELWLKRSAGPNGSYPLDLTIKQSLRGGISLITEECVEITKQVISLAIAQHRRWKYICLELCDDVEPRFQPLYTIATPLPILRGFELDLRHWSSNALRQLMGVLSSSPELQTITLGNNLCRRTDIQMSLDTVSWDRPTTLSFATLTDSMFLRILSSSMDTLRHLSVKQLNLISIFGVTSLSPTPTPNPHGTMCCLQSIHINAISRGDIAATFDNLTLPVLRELRLPGGFGSKKPRMLTRGWNSIVTLLERSNCKLQTFEFGDDEYPGSRFTEAFLTQNLKSSPVFEHITKLRVTSGIGRHPDSLQLLDALSEACEDTQEPSMLPLLETLILDSVCSVEAVRRMVSDRVAAYGGDGGSKLCRVSADLNGKNFALDMDLSSRV